MYDCEMELDVFQRQLDQAGVDFDVSSLAGANYDQIADFVSFLLIAKRQAERVSANAVIVG